MCKCVDDVLEMIPLNGDCKSILERFLYENKKCNIFFEDEGVVDVYIIPTSTCQARCFVFSHTREMTEQELYDSVFKK